MRESNIQRTCAIAHTNATAVAGILRCAGITGVLAKVILRLAVEPAEVRGQEVHEGIGHARSHGTAEP